MGTRLIGHMRRGGTLAALSALALAGCSMANPVLSSSAAGPRVEDCALISQGTPSKFVCGGKTYTSIQLADIRNGKTPAK